MKSSIPVALIAFCVLPLILIAQGVYPRMTTVEPPTAKAGAVLSVAGENLDKANVAEVYLTDGKNDVKLEITEQAAAAIKVRVPDSVKPGRFSLMVLTTTRPPQLIEQPVKVTIE
jgi:hypothetical protein